MSRYGRSKIIIPTTPEMKKFRRSSCERKAYYSSSKKARIVTDRYPDQRVYHCRFCDGYHISSTPKEEAEILSPPWSVKSAALVQK